MIPMDRLAQITQRFQFLEASMSAGSDGADFAKLAKEYADLRPVVEQIEGYRQLLQDMDEARAMLKDPEMAELAEEELPRLKAELPKAEASLQLALLPKDAADAKPAMLEIRPGTGGQRGRRPYQGPECLCPTEIRIRRPPCATRAVDRKRWAYPYLGRDRGGAARSRGCRYSHRPQ